MYRHRRVSTSCSNGCKKQSCRSSWGTFLLLQQDYVFEVIDLRDYAPTKKHFLRLKGRVIGSEGKSRRIIEELTETYLSVYGKTISLIGQAENISLARKAVEGLLEGSPHSNIYKWLEGRRKEMKRSGLM